MALQPFGYPVNLYTPRAVADAKAILRAGMKPWFHGGPAPRGWIMGPFLCLWHSANNKSGPMLLAHFVDDGFGTKIRGRAGSDLNGVLVYLVMLPLLLWIPWQAAQAGQMTGDQCMAMAALLLLSPLILWWSHKNRHQADPLVRFIEVRLGATHTD